MQRYIRQLALPEIDLIRQEALQSASIIMIGAGGLGAPCLPYLAGAGIGNITIVDHDEVDVTNLHRQTIFQTAQTGRNKAKAARDYLQALNPEITIHAICKKLTAKNASDIFDNRHYDLILDGSDNFETKSLLNDLSIKHQTPLISASVNQFSGQIGIFEGYSAEKPCYRCLFPDFPHDVKNCNEAGILGTSAGIIGTTQAHIALCLLLDVTDGISTNFTSIDLKTLRNVNLLLKKQSDCKHCKNHRNKKTKKKEKIMIDLIDIKTLNDTKTIVIDVRQPEELVEDPLHHPNIETPPLHIPLPELVRRLKELPKDKRLAFLCAGNIRSRQAAEYLHANGHGNVCVLDKFSL